MTLLENFNADARTATAKALVDYRELLHRNGSPQPNDAKHLREVVAAMHLAGDDVEADIYTLAAAAEQRAAIVPPDRIKAMREAQKKQADEADAVFREATKRLVDEVERYQLVNLFREVGRYAPTSSVADDAAIEAFVVGVQHSETELKNAVAASNTAANALRKLEQDNPRLFGA